MNKNYIRINEENVLVTLDNGEIKLVKNTENMGKILAQENVLELIEMEESSVIDRIKETKRYYDNRLPVFGYVVAGGTIAMYLTGVDNLNVSGFICAAIAASVTGVAANFIKDKYYKYKSEEKQEKLQEELIFLGTKYEKEKRNSDNLLLNSKKINKVDTKNIKKVSSDKSFKLMDQLNTYRSVLEDINYYIEIYDNGMLYNELGDSLDKKDIERLEEYIKRKGKIE